MLAVVLVPAPGRAASDAELIRGFNLTVFGAEFSPFGIQSRYIRKFSGPVRFTVHNLAKTDRSATVRQFILSLNRQVRGLTAVMAPTPLLANFNVYLVDNRDYVEVARQKVYRQANASVPGKCLVRSVFSRAGIVRSDAVVVADRGERLFQRCMVEEILQGLGPLNEHPSLGQSMFNDRSKHTRFTRFDRIILNMLYDRRIVNGASFEQVQPLLPAVLRDVKRRL